MACKIEANVRICSSVSEALSYMPCTLQYTEPSNQNELFVFWSQHNDEFPTIFPTTADTTMYHDAIKEKITYALNNAYISDYYGCWLVQFWVPVTTNGQSFLTTCDLPFGLTKLHQGLFYYRSECLNYKIPIGTDNSKNEYQLGPTGRVFTHGLPEMSPDVSRYSATDYPQLGLALTAGLGNYLAIPVFEPLSNQCTGVLEIIGDKKGSFSQELVQMVYEMLKKVDLRSSIMYDHPDKKGPKGLERALKELEEQLSFICRTHQLPLAQTWLPAPDGSYIERFMTTKEQFCMYTSAGYEFRAACDMFHLGKSQGVVGRAFLSRNSCFCSDITKLCMSEYPLAHVAHKVGFHGSFAICLQSSYTGDYVYLLEFFLPQDNKSDCRSPQTMLNMLLATMKRQFRSFKLASGRELGEKLFVEVIPVPSDDGQNSFEICQNPKQSSDVEPITRQKILWLDTLNRSLNGGSTVNPCPPSNDATAETTANTITEVRNVSIQANRVVCTSSEEESMRNILEGQYRVNSLVLQQAVSEKNDRGTTLARLTTQPLPNNCGREHHDLSDISCSSHLLQSTKAADGFLEKTSGNDQSYHHDTAGPLARATSQTMQLSATPRKRSNFLSSDFPAGNPERSPKVSKLFDISSEIKFWQREAETQELQTQELQTTRESQRVREPKFNTQPRQNQETSSKKDLNQSGSLRKMVRAPCDQKMGLKKGPWTPDEDQILISYIRKNGHGNWRALPKLAGLLRCGKSCRLRWINYLRPDIKRGNFTKEEEDTIIQLHETLGNRWSAIAARFPGRTDNEIKNVWQTHLKKRLKNCQPQNPKRHIKNDDTKGPTTSESSNKSDFSSDAQQYNNSPQHSSSDISTVTAESLVMGWAMNDHDKMMIKNDEMESSEYFPEISESFWTEELSTDNNCSHIMPADDEMGTHFNDDKSRVPFSSVREENVDMLTTRMEDDMDFWYNEFIKTDDLQELPEF